MKLTLMVATDKNFGIGVNGDMLFYIKNDLKRFKEKTTDNIVIMGRRTFEALPNEKGLPNRTNVVFTRKTLIENSIITVNSIEELEIKLENINSNDCKIEYIIGGGKLVKSLWQYIDKALITIVEKEYKNVDTYIPNLFKDNNFELTNKSKEYYDEETKLKYRYYEFNRKKTF